MYYDEKQTALITANGSSSWVKNSASQNKSLVPSQLKKKKIFSLSGAQLISKYMSNIRKIFRKAK